MDTPVFRVGWNLTSRVHEVDVLPGDAAVSRVEPLPLPVVVERIGVALDGIPAPRSTKRQALECLLTELEDQATRDEPTFSRRLDPETGDRAV